MSGVSFGIIAERTAVFTGFLDATPVRMTRSGIRYPGPGTGGAIVVLNQNLTPTKSGTGPRQKWRTGIRHPRLPYLPIVIPTIQLRSSVRRTRTTFRVSTRRLVRTKLRAV